MNGKCHRKDGPAVEWVSGIKEWYLNGELHREDGPAIETSDGTKEWYINDVKLSEELFLKLTQGPQNELPLYLGLGFDEYIGKRLESMSNLEIDSNGTKIRE